MARKLSVPMKNAALGADSVSVYASIPPLGQSIGALRHVNGGTC